MERSAVQYSHSTQCNITYKYNWNKEPVSNSCLTDYHTLHSFYWNRSDFFIKKFDSNKIYFENKVRVKIVELDIKIKKNLFWYFYSLCWIITSQIHYNMSKHWQCNKQDYCEIHFYFILSMFNIFKSFQTKLKWFYMEKNIRNYFVFYE